MPKIGRTLSYINTERKGKSTEQSPVSQSLGSSRPGGSISMPQGDYLLKSIWDKVFEIRTDSQGIEYIFGKLPMVTQYGITMYSGDGVDIPSLASGLPFDGRTIWYNPDTNQIEVIGGTGGGSGEGVSNFWDLSGIPSWITNTKPKYTYSEIEGTPDLTKYALASQIPSLSGYATESWVLQKNYATKATTLSGYGITDAYTKTNVDDLLLAYVTLGGRQTITGEKNFVGGLKVNGSPIYYDTEKKYWKLEGDLLVTGGVTMYGSDSSFVPSTIMDAILYDSATLGINSNGQLYVKGGTSGGGLDITALQNYLTQNSYLNVTSGDNRYLQLSGGMITGENDQVPLAISNTASTLRIGFVRNNEVLGYLGFIEANKPLFYDKDGNGRLLLHERNYSSYALPLTGGRIVGKLQIQRTPSNIAFYNADNVLWGHIGFNAANNAVVWDRSGANEYTIWNSGNDGSGSGLDADLLDGKHNGELTASMLFSGGGSVLDANEIKFSDYALRFFSTIPNTSTNFPTFTGYQNGLLALPLHSNGATAQLYFTVGKNPYFRSHHTYEWNELAYKNDNVASATKIQTARTIWGQSFDGTGNVSGALSDVTGITFKDDYYGLVIDSFGNFSFKKPSSTAAADWSFKDSSGNKLMIINNSGNVGIGTANPLHKLHIYSAVNQSLCIEQKFSSNWSECIIAHNSSLSSGQHYSLCIGHSDTNKNRGALAYYHNGEGSDNNRFCLGLHGVDDVVNVLGNGNVGIGTTSPTSKLEVSGAVKANYYDVSTTRQTSLSGSYTLGCGMYGSSIQHSVSDGYTLPALMWSAKSPNGNSSQFSIMSYHPTGTTGYLIIGVAKNGTRTAFIEVQGDGVIQAGGDFLASGGITMYSDQRKKTILNHVELSLKQIADAPLIEHYYNSDEKKTTHVGSIAQYWASMNDWFCKLDNEGYYTMEIQNAALASAISLARELVKFENETDKRIRLLEEENKELRNEIERLKSA